MLIVEELLLIMNGKARRFIDGAHVIYELASENDPIIVELNCTSLNYTLVVVSGSELYLYDCFATDLLAGYLTLLCIFIPGLLMSCFLMVGFWKNSSRCYALIMFILTPVQMASFPFLLVFLKV